MSDEQTTPTKYDVVRQQFADRKSAQRNFIEEDTRFAVLIANGFRDYMGMPKHYERTSGATTKFESYVPFYSLRDDDTFKEESFWGDAIGHYSDGTFEFGVGIVLEPAPNGNPKQILQIKIECARATDNVEVNIAGDSVSCAFDGKNSPDISKVHDLLYRLLNDWLTSRWGDSVGKQQIGFRTA